MIAASQLEMDIVRKIIEKYVPDCTVLAFGSRFKQTHNDASDLDLAIVCEERLSIFTLAHIKEDFMESDIPYKVDVLDYHAVSDSFRKIIDAAHEVVYRKN